MTTIYFVRHAHSTYTPDERERPLSEKGWQDADRVTEVLKNEPIDVVIASPYKRAIQTVEGVAKHFQLSIELEEDVRERLLSLQPVQDFKQAITKVWKNPSFHIEGGESNVIAQGRGVSCIMKILEKYKGKNIVIGTHGNIMVLIMNYFDSKYDFSFWKGLHMPDIYKLTFVDNQLVQADQLWKEDFVKNV
ncbi:histidine phosphatase family protein [Bacillus cytotoxicus]|uniref:Histidine phosphatase family protein n=1 Tax=Bacillus cytotoxicus TaxID=580165 RepID=A0ACC6A761_9BACI|nr:histidine phosphatase family protein [Bacillus cytotoxicus]